MAAHIVQLQEVERLSASVIRILGGNPGKFTLQGTNTYLVGTGRQRLLVDTGEGKAAWISALKQTLQKEDAIISQALITHWHHDHQGGIAHLLELSPNTTIYKHQPSNGQLNIQDGQIFQADGATLRAVFSPGHAQDHMVFVHEEEDAMFTGDNVLGHGTAVFENLATYLNSLQKISGIFGGRAYPGHGPVIGDGPQKILEYVRHRQFREDQVIKVLRSCKSSPGKIVEESESDDWTSMEIVKVIYKDVPEDLHMPANGGVVQVLAKLQEEGRVIEDSKTERWMIKQRSTL